MSDSVDPLQVVLEDEAKRAVSSIASLLGDKQPEEAIQRALGTELYLLQKVTMGKAKVWLEYKDGSRTEVDLFG